MCARAPLPSVVAALGLPGHGRGGQAGLDLARALTRAGFQVLLVQAEQAAPRTSAVPAGGGLSDVLLTGADESDVTVALSPGLSYLSAGGDLLEASEFFGTARMVALVDRLRSRYDYVIVGGPPVTTADGQALAEAADATVLVVELGVTTQTSVTTIMKSGAESGWKVLGAVVLESPSLARRLRARAPLRRKSSQQRRHDGDGGWWLLGKAQMRD